jgi:hypothetical protein
VNWSDETSVVLTRRGQQRCWRDKDEAFDKTVVRWRWKGYSEFMFWGAFSYHSKGPCHIWEPETPQDKAEALKVIEELNADIEPECGAAWEESEAELRELREEEIAQAIAEGKKKPRRRPRYQWKFTESKGKVEGLRSDGRGALLLYHVTDGADRQVGAEKQEGRYRLVQILQGIYTPISFSI